VPVGQESPTRGMGVWAVADTAIRKMEQSIYPYMIDSPECCWVICESEVEKFWFDADIF